MNSIKRKTITVLEVILLPRWHKMLGLPRQSPPSWYGDRLREELQELREARSRVERISETADVLFSISRARYDGFEPWVGYRQNPKENLTNNHGLTRNLRQRQSYQEHYRSNHQSHGNQECPLSKHNHFNESHHPNAHLNLQHSCTIPAYTYMFTKFTSRWAFYRLAARLCRHPNWRSVREVVNPARDGKLLEVATRHAIDPKRFGRVCRGLRRMWPLLP